MEVQEYLDKVAYIGKSTIPEDEGADIYYSKFNGSYITRVGMESGVEWQATKEITEELTNGVGFSPKDGKWYGWSHRAGYGFKVGSTCKKGDCHYKPASVEDEIEDVILFWTDEYTESITAAVTGEGEITVTSVYNDKVPNESLHGTTMTHTSNFNPYDMGKGEWEAETMEDAKQMAVDFCKGVS